VSVNLLRRTLLTELNYPLPSCAVLCKILEMADVVVPNNRATPAKGIAHSFINQSTISDQTSSLSDGFSPFVLK
jgi:hypothetical protein